MVCFFFNNRPNNALWEIVTFNWDKTQRVSHHCLSRITCPLHSLNRDPIPLGFPNSFRSSYFAISYAYCTNHFKKIHIVLLKEKESYGFSHIHLMLPIDYRLLKSGNQLLLSMYSMYYFVRCTMHFQCTAFLYSIWSPMIHLKMVISHLLHAWCCARNRICEKNRCYKP